MAHTNTAVLEMKATDLIKLAGRLTEHELWDAHEKYHRVIIMRHIAESIAELNKWMAEHGTPKFEEAA